MEACTMYIFWRKIGRTIDCLPTPFEKSWIRCYWPRPAMNFVEIQIQTIITSPKSHNSHWENTKATNTIPILFSAM